MVKLPSRMFDPRLRFIKLCGCDYFKDEFKNSKDSIAPIELDYRHNNYNALQMKTWLKRNSNNNYGVITGSQFNNLIVIDFDSKELQDELYELLPETFVVTSAGKRLKHCYYFTDKPLEKKIPVKSLKGRLAVDKRGKPRILYDTIADIQSNGTYVAGGNCDRHGKIYEVCNDKPIANISLDYVRGVFSKWTNAVKKRNNKKMKGSLTFVRQKKNTEVKWFDCWDILKLTRFSFQKTYMNNDFIWGVCPICGISKSNKKNFCISKNGKFFNCERSGVKGTPTKLLMHLENIDFSSAINKIKEWRVNESNV